MSINKNRLIRTFQQLVAVDSLSLAERQTGDYVLSQLRELGLEVHEDNVGERIGGNCGNIYGFLPGNAQPGNPLSGNPQEPLLFSVHMDTVEPGTGKQAIIGNDGVIRSNGDTVLGADDAAGMAAVLEALQVIKENNLPHRPLEVLFSVAEEIYCKGIEEFDFSRLLSNQAYILDLTGPLGTAALAAPTILTFTAAIGGRSAHAGFAPEQGIHAIATAAAAINELKSGRIDPETTLNIGLINGGRATNIVPDSCLVTGEIRSLSHSKALGTTETVRSLFRKEAQSSGATLDFEITVHSLAYETAPDHPVVKRYEAVCQRLGYEPVLTKTFGGSDNNSLAQRDIKGIVIANAMHDCHSTSEYTTVAELTGIAAITLALMTE